MLKTGRERVITCDLSRRDLLVITFHDGAEFLVINDADVRSAITRVLHHHVRQMQPA